MIKRLLTLSVLLVSVAGPAVADCTTQPWTFGSNTISTNCYLGIGTTATGPFQIQSDYMVSLACSGCIPQGKHGIEMGYAWWLDAGVLQAMYQGTAYKPILLNPYGGNVGIGISTAPTATLEVNGTIRATQVIGATYQDVAEWVPAAQAMEAGVVVVLDREKTNQVVPSRNAYDTAVAGVVSAKPGVLLGEESGSKAKIATTGRVHVHADATTAPIRVGDLLVTSDKRGMAMRSEPIEVSGVKIHRPGTLIGKALEPLPTGEGDILVLLSLQ